MNRKRKKSNKGSDVEHVVESEYYENIELTDPVTGEKIITRQKIVRYKAKPGSSDLDDESVDVIDKINDSFSYEPVIDIDA